MSDYLCMDEDELTLWREAAAKFRADMGQGTDVPCVDCPMWFHLQEQAAGRCDRRPSPAGGPPIRLMTPEAQRTRERKRDWMRRNRGSQSGQMASQ